MPDDCECDCASSAWRCPPNRVGSCCRPDLFRQSKCRRHLRQRQPTTLTDNDNPRLYRHQLIGPQNKPFPSGHDPRLASAGSGSTWVSLEAQRQRRDTQITKISLNRIVLTFVVSSLFKGWLWFRFKSLPLILLWNYLELKFSSWSFSLTILAMEC